MLKRGSATCLRATNEALRCILHAFAINLLITHVLSTEATYKFILFELTCITINEACPLVHLMAGLLIKLILIVVVLLLELLTQFPDDIILELQ